MNNNFLHRLLITWICVSLVIPWVNANAASNRQAATPQEKAQALLDILTPEERVGQLFLIVFRGTDVGPESAIYNLIVNYHIGGVILLAANDNFPAQENNLPSILQLNNDLQTSQWEASQRTIINPKTNQQYTPQFIPQFIGISQEGDGYPYDQILSGLTVLPNQMAIGATWDQELAGKVGQIMGNELSALGFNLLLGPDLDVLEIPRSEGVVDLGTRTFGSDPYWVSLLGRAMIRGIHEGSEEKMAVVAKHFPGNGGSDRSSDQEVATVRKSLEQLKNFDLVPFFSVTGNAESPETTVDGLLASHIRYQGFQENIRATTRPISFDPQAINLLMALAPLASWRDNDGIVICDNLGSQAVRQFYQLTAQTYDPRRVALNAFIAGNDLLYLGDISSTDEPDIHNATKKVLDFFAQKYREDQAFAQQVDESVLRILTLKYRLYPRFELEYILPKSSDLYDIGQSSQITFDIARQAATIISPSSTELVDELPEAPKMSEEIVFFTDVRTAQQCTQCTPYPVLPVNAFEEAVKKLYGPQAGGLIWPANLSSYSYNDLLLLLNDDPLQPPIEDNIKNADWLVFAMLNVSEDIPESLALKRFLSERPDLIQQHKIVVFALNGPYYLDATNISKLSAYYALYSKSENFINVASRILFRELVPSGSSPVSVPGIGYDLITATSPNPSQNIPLFFDFPSQTITNTTPTTTPEPTQIPEYQLGALIPVRTGVILDNNGHPVPDGTPVQFITTVAGETSYPQSETTTTGTARITIKVTSTGTWEIRVESEPAKSSDVLRFEVPIDQFGLPTLTPTEEPTATVLPTSTPTEVIVTTDELEPKTPHRAGFIDWLIAVLTSIISGIGAYQLSAMINQNRWGVRGGLLAIIGGLIGYCYLLLNFPGSNYVLDILSYGGVFLTSLFGSMVGILVVWGWKLLANQRSANTNAPN